MPIEAYIHHTPGRLRVRSALVKNNEKRATSAVEWLRTLPGVSSAEANTLTGSLTLRYDPALIGSGGLLDALKDAGYVGHHVAIPVRPVPRTETNLGAELAAKVVKRLAAYAVEEAVVVLVGALL
jgi:hypothetical protein